MSLKTKTSDCLLPLWVLLWLVLWPLGASQLNSKYSCILNIRFPPLRRAPLHVAVVRERRAELPDAQGALDARLDHALRPLALVARVPELAPRRLHVLPLVGDPLPNGPPLVSRRPRRIPDPRRGSR